MGEGFMMGGFVRAPCSGSMAWTDACKIEACAQIEHKKKELGSARKAIKELSKESGIPIRTIERWYWPDNAKNGVTPSSSSSPPKPDPVGGFQNMALYLSERNIEQP